MGRGLLTRSGTVTIVTGAMLCAGCGSVSGSRAATGSTPSATAPAALVRESRPLGRAPRFHPPARGPVIGACRTRLGPRLGVHIEIFAANRVVLLAAGIGTRPPLRLAEGRIAAAGCYGALVTLEPTGVVLVRPTSRLTLALLFRSWGQPLSAHRVAAFAAGPDRTVRVFVGGRRRLGPPGPVPLRAHAEIVLEVGPFVTPHSHYTFPPGA